MNPPFDLEALSRSVEGYLTRLQAVQSGAADEAAVQQLAAAADTIRQSKARLEGSYPQALADLQQRLDAIKQKTEAAQQNLAAARDQLAQASVAQGEPPPPAPPPAPVDPALGQVLRRELLERFDDSQTARRPPAPDREIWEDWSDWK